MVRYGFPRWVSKTREDALARRDPNPTEFEVPGPRPAFCDDVLRLHLLCRPPIVRGTLEMLDETYERVLRQINKANRAIRDAR